jgi:hypothetical protein
MRRTIITLVAGIAIGAAIVAAPALSSSHSSKRYVTLRTGDFATIPTLDLECVVERSDPDGHVTGPVLFCDRDSQSGKSWGVMISRRWIKVASPSYYVYSHPRLP